MKEISRIIEIKRGGKWETTHTQTNETEILHSLASDLAAKYIGKASYVKRITRRNNYDGTQTYVVSYDNDTRATYTTDIY